MAAKEETALPAAMAVAAIVMLGETGRGGQLVGGAEAIDQGGKL